ncbi:hypothetical protein Hanom_Chr01g00022811 [Helianthus anomalus]
MALRPPSQFHLRGWPCILFRIQKIESFVPNSYEGTAISASYDIPIPSNTREKEVVSGIRYHDNTAQLDLNVPVEDSYAQPGYSDYGYGGELCL